MTPFEIVILAAALCGLIMVAGGILLLYRGAITLTQASPDEAVSVEFKKMLKVTTRYPALGLFIIGLSFVVTALVFSKPENIKPLQVRGKVVGAKPSEITVRIYPGEWVIQPSSEGGIDFTIYPKMDLLLVEANAPGRSPLRYNKRLESQELKFGQAALGDIVFSEQGVSKPAADPANIVPVDVQLPPLSARGAFR